MPTMTHRRLTPVATSLAVLNFAAPLREPIKATRAFPAFLVSGDSPVQRSEDKNFKRRKR